MIPPHRSLRPALLLLAAAAAAACADPPVSPAYTLTIKPS